MEPAQLEIKKFELEQRVKLEELALKKQELELRIQEQKGKRIATPLILSIVGGVLTLLTGIVLNFIEKQSEVTLETQKFQSSLILKALEAPTFEGFTEKVEALHKCGFLEIDSAKIEELREERLAAQETRAKEKADSVAALKDTLAGSAAVRTDFSWVIVAGGDANLAGAQHEVKRANDLKLPNPEIWLRNGSFRTCVGKFNSHQAAVDRLFEVKERMNRGAYIERLDKWCPMKAWKKLGEGEMNGYWECGG